MSLFFYFQKQSILMSMSTEREQSKERAKVLDLIYARRARRRIELAMRGVELPQRSDVDYMVTSLDPKGDMEEAMTARYGDDWEWPDVPRTLPVAAQSSVDHRISLYYASERWLHFQNHRLELWPNRQIRYYQTTYDSDCQLYTPPPTINLDGIDQIAANPHALQELLWLSEQVTGTDPAHWAEGGRIALQQARLRKN